jgi:uncharacterized protein
MKKTIQFLLAAFLAMILALPMILPVRAADTYVYDETDTLSADELSTLNTKAEEISTKYSCGVYIVITTDQHGYSEYNYAKDVYMEYDLGYGEGTKANGVLLAIAMDERYMDAVSYGAAKDVFTDDAMESIQSNDVLPYLREDDWYNGADSFLSAAESTLANGGYTDYTPVYTDGTTYTGGGDPANYQTASDWIATHGPLFITLMAGGFGLIGMIIALIMKARLKNIGIQQQANQYIPKNGVQLTAQADYFLYTQTQRVRIPRDNDRGGGGGGGGHTYSSSGFSGGGGGSHF